MILEIIWRCMAKTLCKYLINSRNPKNSIMTTFSIFFLIFNVKFQISKKKTHAKGWKKSTAYKLCYQTYFYVFWRRVCLNIAKTRFFRSILVIVHFLIFVVFYSQIEKLCSNIYIYINTTKKLNCEKIMITDIIWRRMAKSLCKYIKNSSFPRTIVFATHFF